MTELRTLRGFEDFWRMIEGPRVYGSASLIGTQEARARLRRIVSHAPEVVMSMTGRQSSRKGLRDHLAYISRRGELPLQDSEGRILKGQEALQDLVADWTLGAEADSRRITTQPISRSLVVSMPPGTDRDRFEAATRAFTAEVFGRTFDHVFARHDDTASPHAHLLIRALGRSGERLPTWWRESQQWREILAAKLREQGVEAEATPCWLRGVSLQAETNRMRHLREGYERGERPCPRTIARRGEEAARLASGGPAQLTPGEEALLRRRRAVREAFATAANELSRSDEAEDRILAQAVIAFLRDMPPPHTRRFILAQALRLSEREQARTQGADRERTR